MIANACATYVRLFHDHREVSARSFRLTMRQQLRHKYHAGRAVVTMTNHHFMVGVAPTVLTDASFPSSRMRPGGAAYQRVLDWVAAPQAGRRRPADGKVPNPQFVISAVALTEQPGETWMSVRPPPPPDRDKLMPANCGIYATDEPTTKHSAPPRHTCCARTGRRASPHLHNRLFRTCRNWPPWHAHD